MEFSQPTIPTIPQEVAMGPWKQLGVWTEFKHMNRNAVKEKTICLDRDKIKSVSEKCTPLGGVRVLLVLFQSQSKKTSQGFMQSSPC